MLGWEGDLISLDWYGRAVNTQEATVLSKEMMSTFWSFMLRAQGMEERPIPDGFLYSYMTIELDNSDNPGNRLIIDRFVVAALVKENQRRTFDRLPSGKLATLIEQLAWSDETVRRHVLENGPVEIRAEWLTYQDTGIWLDFWMADRGSRRMLGVSELTAMTLLLMLAHCCGLFGKSKRVQKVKLMLERPNSATLMATFPQRRGPDKPELLLDYCHRMRLDHLTAQFQAILPK